MLAGRRCHRNLASARHSVVVSGSVVDAEDHTGWGRRGSGVVSRSGAPIAPCGSATALGLVLVLGYTAAFWYRLTRVVGEKGR